MSLELLMNQLLPLYLMVWGKIFAHLKMNLSVFLMYLEKTGNLGEKKKNYLIKIVFV
jgi:hypothetical protein